MSEMRRRGLLIAMILFAPAATGADTQTKSEVPAEGVSEGERLFALQVQPIFREKCYGCHSNEADELEGEFSLESRETLLAGGFGFGDSLINVGDAETSPLMAMISREEVGFEMPPKDADRLTDEQVWAVRDWIDAGAPWPDPRRVKQIYDQYAAGVTVRTSGGLSGDWTDRKYEPADLWAFQPLRTQFSADSIDEFIDARLEQRGITPAGLADRRTLIRRVTFDLLGLPPTPDEVDEFVNDPRDDQAAVADLIDRLLESPHYGEQWARHWLDVARYSDSSGFANDWERPNAWRYRDYVVRAFNDDIPFDQFTIEQLAGDEVADQLRNDGELTKDREGRVTRCVGFPADGAVGTHRDECGQGDAATVLG